MSYEHKANEVEGAMFRYTARKRAMLHITQRHETNKDSGMSFRGRLYRCWATGGKVWQG